MATRKYPTYLKKIIVQLKDTVSPRMMNERSVKIKPYLNDILKHTSWLDDTVRFTQRIHAIEKDIFSVPICKSKCCNNAVNFQFEHKHYHLYCSRKCMLESDLLSHRSIEKWEALNEDEKERRRLVCIDILNNSSYRYSSKTFMFPSGKTIRVQGTEPTILKGLLHIFDESDILVGRNVVPVIFYEFEGKQHRHYPDIYIKSRNLLIDAKSTWTYFQNLDINHAKQDASKNQGYNYWFAFG